MLTPIALLVMRAVDQYIRIYFSDMSESGFICARIDDLSRRIKRTDEAHEAWMTRVRSSGPRPPHTQT